jgi:hypothetical protein
MTPTTTPTLVTHVVQTGETFARISQAYGVSFELLKLVNGLPDPNKLYVGQVLLIPPVGITDVPAFMFGLTPSTATPLPPNITLTATLPPQRQYFVNGMAVADFVIMPDDVQEHVRQIFAKGQELGRDAHAFSKLGDSTIENPFFMTRFDEGTYNLGDYAYLQSTINYYAGSFARDSLSVRVGLHTWSIFDPMWAPRPPCTGTENMLACEFRVHNPAILFVRMGSNDAGIPDRVDQNLRRVVDFCIENGVIPIMGTKADRFEGSSNINNEIIRQIAVDYKLPIWDFDLVASTIPGRGLGPDHVHLTTFYAHDWRSSVAFQTGHGIHSLTALMMLDALMHTVEAPPISTFTPEATVTSSTLTPTVTVTPTIIPGQVRSINQKYRRPHRIRLLQHLNRVGDDPCVVPRWIYSG